MGKASLFIIVGALVAGGVILYQSELTTFETLIDQSERQEEIIAREIARSGFSAIRARVREVERDVYEFNPSAPLTEIVNQVNGGLNNRPEYDYEGGRYRIWMEKIGLDAYRLNSTGIYGQAEHTISGSFMPSNISNTPENHDPPGVSIVDDFDDLGEDCVAVFLQRFVPITDAGGNSDGSSSGSLLGDDYEQRFARYMRFDPDPIFASGRGRNGLMANINTQFPAGTRVGFVLAVDRGCTLEGTSASLDDYDERYYSTTAHRPGRGQSGGSPRAGGQGAAGELAEGNNVLIEQNETEGTDYVWRIRFEATSDWTSDELVEGKEEFSSAEKELDGYTSLDCPSSGPCFDDFVLDFWMNATHTEYKLAEHAPGQQDPIDVDLND